MVVILVVVVDGAEVPRHRGRAHSYPTQVLGTQRQRQRPALFLRARRRGAKTDKGRGVERGVGIDLDLLSHALLARWRRNEGWPGCWLLDGGLLLSRWVSMSMSMYDDRQSGTGRRTESRCWRVGQPAAGAWEAAPVPS